VNCASQNDAKVKIAIWTGNSEEKIQFSALYIPAEEFHPGTMVLFAKPAGVLEKIAQDRGCNEIAFLSDQGSGPGHVAVQERQRLTKVRGLHF